MKAYTINRYSKNDQLKLSEVPLPTVKENEVLIEIHATSINQLDSKLKSGEFKNVIALQTPFNFRT